MQSDETIARKNKAIAEYLEIIKKKDAEISKLKEDKSRISYNLEAVLSEIKEDEVGPADPYFDRLINQNEALEEMNKKLIEEKRILSNQFEKEKERREDLRNAEQQLVWKQEKIRELNDIIKRLLEKNEDYKESTEELSIGYDQKCREVESLKAQRDKLKVNFDALAESVEKEHKAKEDFNKMISEIKQNELTVGTGEIVDYRIGFSEEKPSHVFSVRNDFAIEFLLFSDAADAFKERDKRNKSKLEPGKSRLWKVELEEIR